jgi:hypothetical protein
MNSGIRRPNAESHLVFMNFPRNMIWLNLEMRQGNVDKFNEQRTVDASSVGGRHQTFPVCVNWVVIVLPET